MAGFLLEISCRRGIGNSPGVYLHPGGGGTGPGTEVGRTGGRGMSAGYCMVYGAA